MKTLTVRMDDFLYDELVRIAQARDISLSDLARETLSKLTPNAASAEDDSEWSRPEVPESLSGVTRLQLSLLHRILARVVEGNIEDGDREYQLSRAEVLEQGYVTEYSDEFAAIEPELSRRETDFVMDVLDMFTQLEWSYGELPIDERPLPKSDEWRVRFAGFDLNSRREGRLLQYARYLIAEDKWERLAVYFDDKHERGNSHMPTYAAYVRMLEVFQPIWKEKLRTGMTRGPEGLMLTAAEIRQITDARVHPHNPAA